MKRVVAISDTHIPKVKEDLPPSLVEALQGADLIVHAGDLVDISVLDRLRELGTVVAVAGNMDYPSVRAVLPEARVVEVEGKRIGVTHGSGPPLGIERRVLSRFAGVDAVVFGHTHSAHLEERKGVLLVNPGTPNDRRFSRRLSYALLEVDEEGIRPEIVWLD
ncbi:metallophosphoesterase [Candidatus Solincola tengchongensis]|uniref:metallophosphoesterase family protein n=1 Tax=Candidatus Solincola tengchongensis TaxID=2900693 RepID=UPI00257D77C1|nr:metallophosphoesterase [Candidatus Solincola tengchongensis]